MIRTTKSRKEVNDVTKKKTQNEDMNEKKNSTIPEDCEIPEEPVEELQDGGAF